MIRYRAPLTFVTGLLLLCSCAASAQQPSAPAEAAAKTIRPEAIRAHMRFLSDSLLQGRYPGTPGYDIAARYVAAELEGMGVQPGGVNGTWFQPVPIRKAVLDSGKSSLVLIADGKEQKLVDAQDYVFNADAVRPENNVEAPIVFVGFGVTAPDQNYDDYSGMDVRGKIVLTFVGAPPRFPSTIRAYYSDEVGKAKNAIAHGAVARLTTLLPEDWKRFPWDWDVPQFQMGVMFWLKPDGSPQEPFQWGGDAHFSPKGAELLFKHAPKSLEQAFATAHESQPQAFPLGWSARIHTVSNQTTLESPSIIGKLVGSDPVLRDQYVVYTAHVDHLGICPPIDGDNVCHGAMDNASGTAYILEIARAYASLPRPPRRSILFVFVTGEEEAFLGSDYFAHFPTAPLDKIAADLNVDVAPGLLFPSRDVVALGTEHSTIGKALERAARQLGYTISPDPLPEENGFIRSDQYSFVLQGVPAVVFWDGGTSTNPQVDGVSLIRKYLTTRYHTPTDSMSQPLDYESGARTAGLIFLAGYETAQQDQPPEWNKNDFFGTKFGSKHEASAAPQR
jgi:hypothetical protein